MQKTLAWFYFFLHLASELKQALFGGNPVSALLQMTPQQLLENKALIEELLPDRPELLARLKNEVIPATQEVQSLKAKIETLEQTRQELTTTFERARATIKARIPRLEAEIFQQGRARRARVDQPVNRIHNEGQRLGLIAEAREGQKLLTIVSAGLSIPNFMALCELLDVPLDRLTMETLVLLPLCLCFSMSVSIGVHLGLTRFIRATRDYVVDNEKPLIKNLFPDGLADKAMVPSLLVIVSDSLFSSVGLLVALPPNVRKELFWQLAIVFVSALASVVNVLLAWGVAQQRINLDLRFKYQGVVEKKLVEANEGVLADAQDAYKSLALTEQQLQRAYRQLKKDKRIALKAYRLWYKEFQASRSKYRVLMQQQLASRHSKDSTFITLSEVNQLELTPARNGHKPTD